MSTNPLFAPNPNPRKVRKPLGVPKLNGTMRGTVSRSTPKPTNHNSHCQFSFCSRDTLTHIYLYLYNMYIESPRLDHGYACPVPSFLAFQLREPANNGCQLYISRSAPFLSCGRNPSWINQRLLAFPDVVPKTPPPSTLTIFDCDLTCCE